MFLFFNEYKINMKFKKTFILIRLIVFFTFIASLQSIQLSAKSQDLLVSCMKLKDELNNDIDCMKILRKEVERSNSIEENMSNKEVKSEFESLERLITKEIDNLSEIKKRMSLFKQKFLQPKTANENRPIQQPNNNNELNLEDLEKKLAMLKGNPITL